MARHKKCEKLAEPKRNEPKNETRRDETRPRQRVERTRRPSSSIIGVISKFTTGNVIIRRNHGPRRRRGGISIFPLPPSLPPRVLRGGNWQCHFHIPSVLRSFLPSFLPSFSSFYLRSHYIVRSVGRSGLREGRKEGRRDPIFKLPIDQIAAQHT